MGEQSVEDVASSEQFSVFLPKETTACGLEVPHNVRASVCVCRALVQAPLLQKLKSKSLSENGVAPISWLYKLGKQDCLVS